LRNFTLEYWSDEGWYVGRFLEIPGVFSQGATLEELEQNIRDAYQLMMEEQTSKPHKGTQIKQISVELG